MNRREVVAGLGAVVAWPYSALSQGQAKLPAVGLLSSVSFESYAERIAAIRGGLKQAGFAEGENATFAYSSAAGDFERLPGLAAELIRRGVNVVVTVGGDAPARAAKAASATVPIVFTTGSDPADFGLVDNLNKPEANITGVSFFSWELGPKRLEILRELLPRGRLFALLIGPSAVDPRRYADDFEQSAQSLGVRSVVVNVRIEAAIDEAFARLPREGVAGIVVSNDAFLNSRRDQIVALTTHHAIPAIFAYREHIQAGGLISYGTDVLEMYHQAGIYAGRILGGAKPGDLPVLLPSKFELLINLKAAKALGLTVPPTLLARADEVFE